MNRTIGRAALSLAFLALLLVSCNGGADDPMRKRSEGDSTVVVMEQLGGACEFLTIFPLRIKALANNARAIMASNDSCVLPLLDSVIAGVRADRDSLFLSALDSLCNYSDGEFGEAMSIAASTLFVDSIPGYVDHLYRGGPGSCLAKHVVWGLRLEYPADSDSRGGAMPEVRRDLETRALRVVGESDLAKRKFVTALLDNAFAASR